MKLAEGFGLKPVMIPSPIDLELKYPKATNCSQILWVGNTNNKIKQPSVVMDLIKQLPSYQFTMIITPIVEEDYICLEESTRSLTNVTMLSRVPFEEIERYFAQAKLLVNTSIVEGFPNTFLQAGKYGLPILSLNVDPNGLLTRHGCGLFCGGSMSELKEGLEKLMTDAELYARLSSNILSYVQIKHDKNRIIPEYERVFNLVLKP
jgi:glycosyltransferase involved in cell wall biosynthesis